MRSESGFFPNKQCVVTVNNHPGPGLGNQGRGLPWVSLLRAHGLLSQRAQWPTPAEPARLGGTEGSLGIAQRPQATPWRSDLRRVPEELVWLREDTMEDVPTPPRHGPPARQRHLTWRCWICSCLHVLLHTCLDLVLTPTSLHIHPHTLLRQTCPYCARRVRPRYAASCWQNRPASADGSRPGSHET